MEYGKSIFFAQLRRRCTDCLRTDLHRGSVMVHTVTTDTRTGNLLVALLAVLSTIVQISCGYNPPQAYEIRVLLIYGISSHL